MRARSKSVPWLARLGSLVLAAGIGCGGSAPEPGRLDSRWTELGIPIKGLREVEAQSSAHGLFATYETSDPQGLLRDVVSALEAHGFTQHKSTAFDEFTRCMRRDTELLVVQVQGLGQLLLFDGEAGDNLMFRVCFDATVIVGEGRPLTLEELDEAVRASE